MHENHDRRKKGIGPAAVAGRRYAYPVPGPPAGITPPAGLLRAVQPPADLDLGGLFSSRDYPCPGHPSGARDVLSPASAQALLACMAGRCRLQPGSELYGEGESPQRFYLLATGWVCQYRILAGGQRHNRKFALPGDLLGWRPVVGAPLDHSAVSLTAADLWVVDAVLAARLFRGNAEIMNSLIAYVAREEALAWERLTCVTRTAAVERVAHLLYGLFFRLHRRPARDGDRVALPLTQEQIGDAIGLSAVHVNRMLAQLRRAGILRLAAGYLTVLKGGRLAALAGREA